VNFLIENWMLVAVAASSALALFWLVCQVGGRASRAAAQAQKLGYERAQALAGGLKAWREASLPVEKA